MTKRLFGLLGILLVCACTKVGTQGPSGAGAGHTASNRAHHLIFADGSGDLNSLNPHLYTETKLGYIAEMTMAYLARYDIHNRPVPELATVIPTQQNGLISRDGKTITWHLRRGVKWSDGVPFDADDVVWSTGAVNNKANNEVGRDGWDLITKVDEPDKYTVVYHLSKPYAAFLPTFFGTAGANPCILPKHILSSLPNINTAPYNARPVGIGPFRVVAWRRGDAVELEANPYYWRGMPKLKRITFKLIPDRDTLTTEMQTGDVDLWPLVTPAYIVRMKEIPSLKVPVFTQYYYAHVDFNLKSPILRDIRVRQALRLALDRKTIRQKIGRGYGVLQDGVISPANPVANTSIPFVDFNPAKAKELLDQAGWKAGRDGIRVKNGRRLTLHFAYYTGAPDTDQEVELMRANWKDAGVDLQTQKYAVNLFFAPFQQGGIMYSGKWDVTTFSWGGDPVGDLSTIYSCSQQPPNGQNAMHYCNPAADAAMDKFKATYSESEHKKYDAIVEEALARDAPTVVLWVAQWGFAYNSNLQDFRPNEVSPFDDMINVDIQ
ncbi:MAG: hypothetical protein DLM50_07730 [Candidatus Meridianibacter frigidus]|nr:MAG: hypothetical protein DLM50_07730 [Candidatus Eremiobacteraeota bacterium]